MLVVVVALVSWSPAPCSGWAASRQYWRLTEAMAAVHVRPLCPLWRVQALDDPLTGAACPCQVEHAQVLVGGVVGLMPRRRCRVEEVDRQEPLPHQKKKVVTVIVARVVPN